MNKCGVVPGSLVAWSPWTREKCWTLISIIVLTFQKQISLTAVLVGEDWPQAAETPIPTQERKARGAQ